MKCNNCNMEWSVPAAFASQVKVCPFCGKSLNDKAPLFTSLEDILTYIFDTFGPETMRNGAKLQSLFADLAPHMRKERTMLRYFIECGGNIALMDAIQKDESEVNACVAGLIRRMEDELMVMPNVAITVCRAFCQAIGCFVPTTAPISSSAISSRSEPETSIPESVSSVQPVEDWKRSEAAHRAWLNGQKGVPAPDPGPKTPRIPDDAWKRSEAAHRAWLKSQSENK